MRKERIDCDAGARRDPETFKFQVPQDAPVTQRRDFVFVKNGEPRRILERDYEEIQRAYVAKWLREAEEEHRQRVAWAGATES